jgi:HD-GYP domain-containing protein (c-di-GMP phosphodiesterase class II)
MTETTDILTDVRHSASIRDELREIGVILVATDEEGRIRWPRVVENDWLARLMLSGRLVTNAIRSAVRAWDADGEFRAIEGVPGVWLVAEPIRERRERLGYVIGIIPTARLLGDEILAAMAQAASFDLTWCRQCLQDLPAIPSDEALRFARLVRVNIREHVARQRDAAEMENMSGQLTESYEEITLLYTIADRLRQIDRADRFMRVVCDELLATLPYEWVGALFADDLKKCSSLAGQLILAGTSAAPLPTMRALLTTLRRQAKPDTARVLDPMHRAEDAGFAPLGQPIVAHPIGGESGVIGILVAGSRIAKDSLASTADLKLIEATARQSGVFLENAALFEGLNRMFVGTLEALTAAIDAKDRYTCGHSQRVAHLTEQLARALAKDEETIARYRIAGLVHDVGKIGVPEAVLMKPGRLTEAEFDLVKLHPEIGHRILRDIPQLDDVLPGVLHHHERWDGKGYPHHLVGEEIPVVARLIGLADAFDAMSSTRTYRASMSRETVLEEIRRGAGTQFDAHLVEAFLGLDFSTYDRMIVEHAADGMPLANAQEARS